MRLTAKGRGRYGKSHPSGRHKSAFPSPSAQLRQIRVGGQGPSPSAAPASSRPARPRAALWELWSSQPRGAQSGVGTGEAPARLRLGLPRRGPGSGGAVAQQRGQGASARPRPRVAESLGPQRPPPPTARRGTGKRCLWGLRGWRAARPGRLRDTGRRQGPGGCRPAVPTSGAAAAEGAVERGRLPAPGIPARPRGPASRRSLRAERTASAVFAAGAGHHPSPPPCPIAVPSLLLTTLLTPSHTITLLHMTLLGPFPCLLSPSPSPEHHPLPIFPVATLLSCLLSFHYHKLHSVFLS